MFRQKINLNCVHNLRHQIPGVFSVGRCQNTRSSRILANIKSVRYSHQNLQGMTHRPSRFRNGVNKMTTVAHNFQVNQERDERLDYVSVESVDEALNKIDQTARRLGRILRKDVYSVFDSVKHLGKMSSIQSLYLIRCCGSLMHDEFPEKRTELVNQIWGKIKELEIPIDASHYNALLKVYLENGCEFSPTDFLVNMEQNGIQPNRVTYQRLIERFCDVSDLSGATTILQYMKDKEMAITEAVFNSLIKGHIKSQDFEGAKNMLEVMRKSLLVPSSDTYSVLACGFAERGNIEEVTSTFEDAAKNGVYLSTKNYMSVIYALTVSGYGQHMDKVLSYVDHFELNRQECTNVVLDLLNKGFIEEAYNLVQKIACKIQFESGILVFLKQLIILGKLPAEKVVEISRNLRNNCSNDSVFINIAKYALENENIACAIELFKEMKKEGLPLRRHYFWPIMAIHIRNGNEQGIYETLREMANFGIPPDYDTFMDFVFRGVSCDDPEMFIKKITETGMSSVCVVEPLLIHYCALNNLKNVLYLSTNYDVSCNLKMVQQFIVSHYDWSVSDNVVVLQTLKSVYESNKRNANYPNADFFGDFFLQLSDRGKLSSNILREAHRMGIEVSRRSANAICASIGQDNPEALQIVRSLQYGAPLPEVEYKSTLSHPRDMTVEGLEECLDNLKASGSSTRGALRQLLTVHCKNKDLEKVLSVKEDLDAQGFIYSPAQYALMIDLFASYNNIKEAEALMNKFKEEYPDIKLDNLKVINYAVLLLKCGRCEDAWSFLNEQFIEINYVRKESLLRSIKKLLNVASDTGDVDLTRNLFNFFMSKLNITSPNFLLEPLVKVHLNRDDFDKALEEYEQCFKAYRFGPCRNFLFKKFINLNDFERLQTVVDLTSSFIGKIPTLHELVFSFIECGQYEHAHKVLQTLGTRAEFTYLEDMSERFMKENKVIELERLIRITKDLNHIDRDKLYYKLLSLYAQNNDCQKATDLWDSLQEENFHPGIQTLRLLANLLAKNDKPIPFVVPSVQNDVPVDNSTDLGSNSKPSFQPDVISQFAKCLSSENVSGIMEALNGMSKGHVHSLSTENMTQAMDILARNNRLEDISTNVQVMSYSLEKARRIFKPLLEKYAEEGNVELIHRLAKFLPDFTLKNVSFTYFYNKAYLKQGLYDDLLEQYKSNLNIFSVYGFVELLKNAPHLEDRALELVEAYANEENFDIPRRALWIHYFTHERYDEAEAIFRNYSSLFTNVDIMASHVLKAVKNTENDTLGKKFIDFINKCGVKPAVRTRAYNYLLDVLINQDKTEEAVTLLKQAQSQKIQLSQFHRRTLVSLKEKLEGKNEPVPFEIPLQAGDSSGSDSE